MARRADEKAALRAERIARERAQAAGRIRRQRLTMAAGIVLAAAVLAVVAVAISSHHGRATDPNQARTPASTSTRATDARVSRLLRGIPQQSDNVLGRAGAPVSVIEYGDLECSVCDSLALSASVDTSDGTPGSGVEDQIVGDLVRTGKVKLIYRSLETETGNGSTPDEWMPQQVAVDAAGMQDKAWNYLELFYNEQGQEGSDYVDAAYLDGLARQIPGLDYAQWKNDLDLTALRNQVSQENREGTQTDDAVNGDQGASTPTILVSGPKGQQVVSLGIPSYRQVLAAISTVG
jgi:protein-disulfide isomerase